MAALIAFKEPHLIAEYQMAHPKIREVVEWIAENAWPLPQLVVTTVFYEGGSGVHSRRVRRGIDLSARKWCYPGHPLIDRHQALGTQSRINGAWDHGSDGKYDVCWFHKSDWLLTSEYHFHVQVRDATTQRPIVGEAV